jgi:hypothetical protein
MPASIRATWRRREIAKINNKRTFYNVIDKHCVSNNNHAHHTPSIPINNPLFYLPTEVLNGQCGGSPGAHLDEEASDDGLRRRRVTDKMGLLSNS